MKGLIKLKIFLYGLQITKSRYQKHVTLNFTLKKSCYLQKKMHFYYTEILNNDFCVKRVVWDQINKIKFSRI